MDIRLLILIELIAFWLVVKTLYEWTYNVFFHPLAKFPGPKLAAASLWYETYFEVLKSPGGQYVYQIDRLHDVYGPIVRINPHELHIKDLDFYDTLYSLKNRRDKDPYHVQIFGTPLSLFGSEEHNAHRVRRQAISPFFSKASVLRVEPMMKKRVKQMCERISSYGKEDRNIPLRDAVVAVTVDIVTEYSFNNCADALAAPDFSPRWEKMMSGVTEAVPMAKAFPGIVQIMQRLPLGVVRRLNPLVGAFFDYGNIIRTQVQETIRRHETSPDTKDLKTKHRSIYQELLESDLPELEKSEERLTQEGIGFISAASETTSLVLATILFHLYSDRNLIDRIRDEVRSVMPDPCEPADWYTLERLPVLSSSIKEGLRITTAICGRLPLKSPDTLQFDKWVIPPGTSVSMSARDALISPEVFMEPTKFLPDRWFTEDDTLRQKMDRAFLPFNKGPRMCVGFNLAYADLYLNVSSLVRRFDFELVDTIRERDVDMVRDHFVAKPTRGSKGVQVRVTKEFDI